MTQKFFTTILFMLMLSPAFGRQISIEEASQTASTFYHEKSATLRMMSPRSEQLKLAYQQIGTSNQADVYIFNRGDNDGFVIVSGDDRAIPVLGYSDTGKFDIENMPTNMQAWLEEYSRQIEWLRNHSDAVYRQAADNSDDYSPISPLITTKWSQTEPYYNECPEYRNKRCVTGCSATAMAMVMKHHNYPTTGIGSHTYTPANNRRLGKLTADFGNTTYDWDNMIDEYHYGQYTDEQAQAVATLMYHCGVSLDMQYDPTASGAHSTAWMTALKTYFGYDDGIHILNREYFSSADWNKMIYDELVANRPVLYSGMSAGGGHAFICDGYSSNGYFHINWGWGGVSDGYFLFSALDPYEQGTGGGEGGFNYMQDITIGIMPEDGEIDNTYPRIFICGDFVYDSFYEGNDWFGFANEPQGNNGMFNLSGEEAEATIGLYFINEATGEEYTVGSFKYNFLPLSGFGGFGVDVGSLELPDGTYKVYPVCQYQDGGEIIIVSAPYRYQDHLLLNVANGVRTYSDLEIMHYDLSIHSFNYDPIYTGEFASLSIIGRNKGDINAYEKVSTIWTSQETGESYNLGNNWLRIAPNSFGETIIEFDNFPLDAGTYKVDFMDSTGNKLNSEEYTVEVSAGTTVELTVTDYPKELTDYHKFDVSFDFSNTGYRTFKAPLYLTIFDEEGATVAIPYFLDIYSLDAGETKHIEASLINLSELIDGMNYTFVISYYFFPIFRDLTEPISFTYRDNSGIEGVNSESPIIYGTKGEIIAPKDARVFNLSGIETGKDNLPSGIYLVKYNNKTTKVVVK